MIMSKELDVAVRLLFGLKMKTLRAYARSHNIKLGKNKAALIENIVDAVNKWQLIIQAVPKDDIVISIVLMPNSAAGKQK